MDFKKLLSKLDGVEGTPKASTAPQGMISEKVEHKDMGTMLAKMSSLSKPALNEAKMGDIKGKKHSGSYGTEYQGDEDEDDDKKPKAKDSSEKKKRGGQFKGDKTISGNEKFGGADDAMAAMGVGKASKSKKLDKLPAKKHSLKEYVEEIYAEKQMISENQTLSQELDSAMGELKSVLYESSDMAHNLAKLARVIKSVETPEQYAAAKKYAGLMFDKLKEPYHGSFVPSHMRKLTGMMNDIESDLKAKRKELSVAKQGHMEFDEATTLPQQNLQIKQQPGTTSIVDPESKMSITTSDPAVAAAAKTGKLQLGKVMQEESTTDRDNRAEKAGRKVTKDLEYDMYHHGKDDDKAERAGRKVAKDIEYDEKHHMHEEQVDEISQDLAKRYYKAADADRNARKKADPNDPKISKRTDGKFHATLRTTGTVPTTDDPGSGKFLQRDLDETSFDNDSTTPAERVGTDPKKTSSIMKMLSKLATGEEEGFKNMGKGLKAFATNKPEPMNESMMHLLEEDNSSLEHIVKRFKHEVKKFLGGDELDMDLYDALYDYYSSAGEMPYGIAKARTGDPYQWIADRLYYDLVEDKVEDILAPEDTVMPNKELDETQEAGKWYNPQPAMSTMESSLEADFDADNMELDNSLSQLSSMNPEPMNENPFDITENAIIALNNRMMAK